MKYKDADEFKKALDEQLKEQTRSLQEQHDMKARISTERILARLDPREAFLQGGAATKYTVPNSPYTKDVDLIVADEKVKEMGWDKMQPDERAESMRTWLAEELSESKGDHFKFRTDQAYAIKDLGDGEPCARVIVAVEIGRHDFHLYEVDLAMQNKETPTREMPGHDLLGFAQVENPEIRALCPEYIIADKVTLYLKENGKEDFERVNDVAHVALIIENTDLDLDRLTEGLSQYAIQRDVVNELIERIPDAPERWEDKFQESMEQSKSDLSLAQAMDMVRDTVDMVRDRAFDAALERYEEMARGEHNQFHERNETADYVEPERTDPSPESIVQHFDLNEPPKAAEHLSSRSGLDVIVQDLTWDLDLELNGLKELSSLRDLPYQVGHEQSQDKGDKDLARELYYAQDRTQELAPDLEAQQSLEILTQLQAPPQTDRSVERASGTANSGIRTAGMEHAGSERTGMEHGYGFDTTDSFDRGGDGDADRNDADMDRGSDR